MNSKESAPLQLFKFYSNRDIKVLKDRDMDYLDSTMFSLWRIIDYMCQLDHGNLM